MLVVALATLPCLGHSTLFDRDEGYYASAARDMLERGDLFVPHIAGKPWMEKPPFTYWAMMASIASFGANAFAARLPSALFGLVLLALTMRLGTRVFGPLAGFLAGLVLASSLLVALVQRQALLDMPLACTVTLSLHGLLDLASGRTRRGFWLFYVGAGLGLLVKGPLGAALPFFSLVGHAVWTRRLHVVRELRPVRGLAVTLAIAALWAVPAAIATHGEALRELVWVRTLQPIFEPLQGHGGGSSWSYLALLPVYLPVVLLGLVPWSPFLVAALRDRARPVERSFEGRALVLGSASAQFLAFSLVSTKLAHYVLPLFPALAVVVGGSLARALEADPTGATLMTRRRAAWVAGSLLALGAAVLAMPSLLGFEGQIVAFTPAALAFALGGLAIAWSARNARPLRALVWTAATPLLALALLSIVALPRLDAGKSASHVAEFLKSYTGARGIDSVRIALCNYRQYSILFYLDRDTTRIAPEEIGSFLAGEGPAVVVVPAAELSARGEESLPANASVLWRKRSWIADKNRWTEIVVLGNRPSGQ